MKSELLELFRRELVTCRDCVRDDVPLTRAHRLFLDCAAGRRSRNDITDGARDLLQMLRAKHPAATAQAGMGAQS
ncbi:hypothetical protein [Nisaea sediminum]|uniref:hypothetical protein n=1 Tax=Nisaea sediminum TaxID=2775867 RepID=UPI0018660305|nr:hypothetical protein [Nisaea sediminum]